MDTPKLCPHCGIIKTLSDFYKDKSRKDGVFSWCKTCQKQSVDSYREKNHELVLQRKAAYREKRREELRLKQNEYYKQHREERLRYVTRFRQENAEVIKRRKAASHKANPAPQMARNRNRKARIRNAEGKHTGAEIRDLFKRQKGSCYYCHKKLINPFTKDGVGEIAHLDHVIPLDRGGRNSIDNLVWACQFCNSSKQNRLPHEWKGNGGRLI